MSGKLSGLTNGPWYSNCPELSLSLTANALADQAPASVRNVDPGNAYVAPASQEVRRHERDAIAPAATVANDDENQNENQNEDENESDDD